MATARAADPAYGELLAELYRARRFGMRLGLERMDRTLAILGHPERRLGRVVHVGGTNGKGSTAAMLEAMLRAAGVRTGLYTSPHLHRFTERIRVAGEEVAPEALRRRVRRPPRRSSPRAMARPGSHGRP